MHVKEKEEGYIEATGMYFRALITIGSSSFLADSESVQTAD